MCMWLCTYVCIYVCQCAYVCTYVCTYVSTYIGTYIRTYTLISLCICCIYQGSKTLACCLLKSVHAKDIFQNGSITQHQQDVNSLFMVDVKEMIIDLIPERVVRVPVYVVSFIHIHAYNADS